MGVRNSNAITNSHNRTNQSQQPQEQEQQQPTIAQPWKQDKFYQYNVSLKKYFFINFNILFFTQTNTHTHNKF